MYANIELQRDLARLHKIEHLKIYEIGETVLGNSITVIKAGKGSRKLLVISGHHALETITSKFLCDYLQNKDENTFLETTLYAIPLLNVDGADFHAGRIDNGPFTKYREQWQANVNGVDLNHNYDAGFYIAKQSVKNEGITQPHFTKYGGKFPFCEPETKAVKKLCEKEQFDMAIALHTQGEELYFGYNGVFPNKTFTYLNKFEEASGYMPSYPTGTASHSGFKDWFIKTFKKPAYTIEAGLGVNPIDDSQYDTLYSKLEKLLDEALKCY